LDDSLMHEIPQSHVVSTLTRLARANNPPAKGIGIQPGHLVPLCKYHSRSIAAKLTQRLVESGIRTKTGTTRMYVSISVAFENRQTAFQILKDFQESHSDTKPRSISRDYDAVFLIGFATLVFAAISVVVPTFTKFAPFAVLTTGISLCLMIERWHRQYRYHDGKHFTIIDLFVLTTIVAVNCAAWSLAV